MAKREFEHPLLGWLFREFVAYPVTRERVDSSREKRTLSLLASGKVAIFPEGTRGERIGLGSPRPGIPALAVRAGEPIVPVFDGETEQVLQGGHWAGEASIRVRFGPPFPAPARRVSNQFLQRWPGRLTHARLTALVPRAGESLAVCRRNGKA